MFDRLDALRRDFPDKSDIAAREAMSAVNVTSRAGEFGEWPRVDAMFDRLDALRQAFPDNEEILLCAAQAAVNVTFDAGKAEDWSRIEAVYQRVAHLAQVNINNRHVVGICGHAVSGRYAAYRRAGKPLNKEIAAEAASGARTLILKAIAQDSHVGAETCLMVIKDAQLHFPNDENIADVYRWGTDAGIDWDQVREFDR